MHIWIPFSFDIKVRSSMVDYGTEGIDTIKKWRESLKPSENSK
jgi:hypothetical protein